MLALNGCQMLTHGKPDYAFELDREEWPTDWDCHHHLLQHRAGQGVLSVKTVREDRYGFETRWPDITVH